MLICCGYRLHEACRGMTKAGQAPDRPPTQQRRNRTSKTMGDASSAGSVMVVDRSKAEDRLGAGLGRIGRNGDVMDPDVTQLFAYFDFDFAWNSRDHWNTNNRS